MVEYIFTAEEDKLSNALFKIKNVKLRIVNELNSLMFYYKHFLSI